MKGIWVVPVVLGIALLLGLSSVSVYAAPAIIIDNGSSNIEGGKLKVKVDVSGFSESGADNFLLVVIIRNFATGEQAFDFIQFDTDGKIKDKAGATVGGNPDAEIEKATLELSKGTLKMDSSFANFTPTSDDDFELIMILRNTSNGEQAVDIVSFSEI